MILSLAELRGDFSDKAFTEEAQTWQELGVKGLPGFGISEEANQSVEHRVCMKCGDSDFRWSAAGMAPEADQDSVTDVTDELRAIIAFHFAEGETASLDAADVVFDGNLGGLIYLPPAYLDKILHNAREVPGAVAATLQQVTEFMGNLAAARQTDPDKKLDGRVPLDPELETANTTIKVELFADEASGRVGASTEFAPPEAENQAVAQLGFFALWDKIAPMLNDKGLDRNIAKMRELCAFYNEYGAPELADLGLAPFHFWST
jgi:hypothetical protein